MKYIVKSLVLLILLLSSQMVGANFFGSGGGTSYPCQGGPEECSIDAGVTQAYGTIDGVEQDRPLSVFVVDIVKYLLTFLGLIGVAIIIYAGFNILISAGDEEKVKTSRKMIIYVLIGLTIIFLAYSIVFWFEGVLNAPPTD